MKIENRVIDTIFADSNIEEVKLFADGEEIPGCSAKNLPPNLTVAKIVKWNKGSVIPKHHHNKETFKFILRGRVETPDGEVLIAGIGDYRCGGFEYGPWLVLEDTYILVLTEPDTGTYLD